MFLSSSSLLFILTFWLLILSLCANIIKYVEVLLGPRNIVLVFGLLSIFQPNFVHNLLNLGFMSLQQFHYLFKLLQDPRVPSLKIGIFLRPMARCWRSFGSIAEDFIEVFYLEHAFHLLLNVIYESSLLRSKTSGAAELRYEDIAPAEWLVSNVLFSDVNELHRVKSVVDGRHE